MSYSVGMGTRALGRCVRGVSQVESCMLPRCPTYKRLTKYNLYTIYLQDLNIMILLFHSENHLGKDIWNETCSVTPTGLEPTWLHAPAS